MNTLEKHIQIAAKPATIFNIYADVDHWHTWDPDTKSAHLNNGLQLGSKGRIMPTKGLPAPITVTSVEINQHFTVTSKTPLFCMVFEHVLTPSADGLSTQVVHRVQITGLMGPLLRRIIFKQLEHGLPITLQNLKAKAEANDAFENK